MSGYDFVDEHLLMLSDEMRTNAYRAAIEAVVKPGMSVLDFGTGSGALAFFAARAGARVYAVDKSPFIPESTSPHFGPSRSNAASRCRSSRTISWARR